MGWFVVVLIYIASYVIQRLTAPHLPAPKTGGAGEFTKPTADSGRPIQVVFGTCRIDSPNVLWYGNVVATAIRRSGTTIGQKYYIGLELGLCLGPIDELVTIFWGDKNPDGAHVASGESAPQFPIAGPDPVILNYNLPTFYGSGDSDGGLGGDISFFFGSQDQGSDDYLEEQIGKSLPGYPGLCRMVLRGFYVGTSGSLDQISPVVRRCPNGLNLTGGKHNIDGDANPMCMIYELLTSSHPLWGLGISPGMIDLNAFRTAAEVLYQEGFGLSMLVDTQRPADEWISEISRHIDGLIYTDLFTGLVTVRLARFDYDPENLPLLDESAFESVEITRRGLEETSNVIRVKYTAREKIAGDGSRSWSFKPDVVQAHDIANQAMRAGAWSVTDLDFPGISNATLAAKVAERERQTYSYPFASLTAVANRRAWGLQPGSVLKLNWAPNGISGMTVRVGKISSGTLTEGKMTLELTEDVFAVSWTSFSPPPPGGWSDPRHAPHAPVAHAFHQMPFELVRGIYDPSRSPRGLAMIARDPRDLVTGFNIHRLVGSSWSVTKCDATTPLGLIPTGKAAPAWADEIWVQPVVDLGAIRSPVGDKDAGGFFLAIAVLPEDQVASSEGRHSEIFAYQTVTTVTPGLYRLGNCRRGSLDTVPRPLPVGTQVWFIGYGYGMIAGERPSSSTPSTNLQVKLSPFNGPGGEYPDWANEALETLGFSYYDAQRNAQREDLAYPATLLHIGGFLAPTNIAGAFSMNWLHRDRFGVWSLDSWGATPGIETGWCYHIYIYSETGALIYSDENLIQTFVALSLPDEIAASGLGRANSHMRVVLETALPRTGPTNVLHAWQAYDHEFDCSGWGMLWNAYFGGDAGQD